MSTKPKILLINTSVTMIKRYRYVFGYPIGLMSLIGYIREQGFDNVSLLDFNVPGEFENFEETFQREDPDIVGLCGLTVDQEGVEYTGKKIKEWKPQCIVICGGPYASASYNKVTSYPFVDLTVIGEGELTFTEILTKYRHGEKLTGIKGTAYQTQDGSVKLEAIREPIMDLDSLPLPAYDMVDRDFYANHMSMAPMGIRPYMALFSSRACPYRCTYCHDIFGKTFRAMSPERIVQVIEHIIDRYGIRDFEFYDDIWNLDRDRVKRFCELIIEKGLDITYHFPNGVRMDRFTEELLTLMARSGCCYMAVAVESPDRMIQKQIKKFNKMDKVCENIAIADRLGIYMMGYFMIGFPGESYRQILKTCWFMISSRLTAGELFTVTPFEGTELHDELVRSGRLRLAENQEFDVGTYHHRIPKLTPVPAWLLVPTKKLTYVLTYGNPVRIYKILTRIPYRTSFLFQQIYGLIMRILGRQAIQREDYFKELSARERGARPATVLVKAGLESG